MTTNTIATYSTGPDEDGDIGIASIEVEGNTIAVVYHILPADYGTDFPFHLSTDRPRLWTIEAATAKAEEFVAAF